MKLWMFLCAAILVCVAALCSTVAVDIAYAADGCAKNEVHDDTYSTSNTVDPKTGDITVACENGREYTIEPRPTSLNCRPLVVTVGWQSGVTSDTDKAQLGPAKFRIKTFDERGFERYEEGIEDCPAGQYLGDFLKTNSSVQSQLTITEVMTLAPDHPDDAGALQRQMNTDFEKSVTGAFASKDTNDALTKLQFRAEELKSNPSASVGDIVRFNNEVGVLENEVRKSGESNPLITQQIQELKTDMQTLAQSRLSAQESSDRIDRALDEEVARRLRDPIHDDSLSAGSTFGQSPLVRAPSTGGTIPLPPVNEPKRWEALYDDTTGDVIPPLPEQKPPLPERRPELTVQSAAELSQPSVPQEALQAALRARNLSEYYAAMNPDADMPSSAERANTAMGLGLGLNPSNPYRGTATQNIIFLCRLKGGIPATCGTF